MSRLEELIAEYCPHGVPFKRFDEICSLHARIGWQRLTKAEYMPSGKYMLVTGTDFTSNHEINYESCVYVSEERYLQDPKIQLKDGDVLITKDGTLGKVAQVHNLPMNATLNGGVFVVRCNDGSLDNRFILHYLLSAHFSKVVDQQKTGSTISHLTQGLFSRLLIPVPPLPVQREIVRILDNFTELTTELTAELTARKKQYEYYRDDLLHLNGERIAIQDLFETRNGFTPSKDNPEYWEEGNLPWFKLDDINDKGRVLSDSYLHITSKALKKSGLFPKDSIIISTSATIGEYALITVPFLCNQRFTCLTVKPQYKDRVYIKYLMHYCPVLSKYCKEHLNQGNFASVDMKQFARFEFVIPPLEEQHRVVAILDRFDALCNDVSSGLPAEIEARQKQYEHYRDKLLTFKEKEA